MADHKGGESEPRLRKVWTPEDAARVKMSNEERKDLNRRLPYHKWVSDYIAVLGGR